MSVFVPSLKQSFKSLPFVFKKATVYVGAYYLPASILFLILLNQLFPSYQEMSGNAQSLTITALNLIAHAFLVFLVPYYTYTYIKGSEGQQAFFPFVARTVWPFVINYIKAFFVILLFLLLLIIPGIYKAIRYTFLGHTVFFDDLTKRPGSSALKAADQTSRGYFWWIVLFLILYQCIQFLPTALVSAFSVPSLGHQILNLILSFYVGCFYHLWLTCFYFEIKNIKGEAVSC